MSKRAKSCTMCGHPVGGPPAKDVRKESRCFPCLAGLLEIRTEIIRKSLNIVWNALSDILNAPALAIPVRLRRRGVRAIKHALRDDQRLKELE